MTESAAVTAQRNPLDVDQVVSKPALIVWIGPERTPLPTTATESLHPWFYVAGYLDGDPVEDNPPDDYVHGQLTAAARLSPPVLIRLPWSGTPPRVHGHARIVGCEFSLIIRTSDGDRIVVPRAVWWRGETDVVEVLRDGTTGAAYRIYKQPTASPAAEPDRSTTMQPTTAAAAAETGKALDLVDAINRAHATLNEAETAALAIIEVDAGNVGVKAATLVEIGTARIALADLVARQDGVIERVTERRKPNSAGDHY